MKTLLVSGGLLVDGTGVPGRRADLLIENGRITAIGEPGLFGASGGRMQSQTLLHQKKSSPLSPAPTDPGGGQVPGSARGDTSGSGATEVIDATGRVVAPGFIDLHSHGDLILALADPARKAALMTGRVTQGITTEVVGNCGLGPAPLAPEHEAVLRGILGWMTPERIAWPWKGIGEYLDHLERTGVPVNVATLVAHGAVRIREAGLARALPAAGSLANMRDSVREALDDGAFGLSLGLIYPPGSFTPTDEILPLAEVLAAKGALLTAHVRGSSETLLEAVGEILDLGRLSGARIHHSHSEAVGPDHWEKIPRVLEMEAAARREGIEISYDMFPYTAAATTMAAIYPPWSLEGGIPALLERLRDAATRRRIGEEIATHRPVWPPWVEGGWAHNLVAAVGWERITIGSVGSEGSRDGEWLSRAPGPSGAAGLSGAWELRGAEGLSGARGLRGADGFGSAAGLSGAEGLSVAELARRERKDPFDAISDLLIAEEGRVSQIIHGISGEPGREEGIAALVRDPAGAFCTDANDTGRGRPHPAAWGSFPKILGGWVRERGALTLEEAVRKMTGLPASLLGLEDRGVLRVGAAADVVIFDPSAVGSGATWAEPRRQAEGIEHVLVNGRFVVKSGSIQAGMPGAILRRR